MVKTSFKKTFFIPYTVLEYLKVEHRETCDTMEEFFERQMINSKLLVHSGERDRNLFFNRMLQKINILREKINIEKKSSFL